MLPGHLGGHYYKDKILGIIQNTKGPKNSILEMCCGSGIISKHLSDHLPHTTFTCADIFDYSNYINHCKFIQSNGFTNINNTYDIIICSPPWYNRDYVDNIHPDLHPRLWQDKNWEFHRSFYKKLPDYLNSNGRAYITNTHDSQAPEFWKSMCPLTLNEIYTFPEKQILGKGFYKDKIRYSNYILEWESGIGISKKNS